MSDELADQLQELGIAPSEARVYLELSRAGTATAGEVAKAAKASRPKAYRALESLSAQGFITSSSGRPRTFAAVPPAIVLKTIQMRAQAILERIEKARADLVPKLERLRGTGKATPQEPSFTVLRGAEAWRSQLEHLCGGAAHHLDVVFAHKGGKRLLETLEDPGMFAARAASGARVRVLLDAQARLARTAAVALRHQGIEVRLVATSAISTIVLADRRELVLVVTANGGPGHAGSGALAFRTDGAHFVAMHQLLFDQLWGAASPVALDEAANRRKS